VVEAGDDEVHRPTCLDLGHLRYQLVMVSRDR
jgi:hypothetical protein